MSPKAVFFRLTAPIVSAAAGSAIIAIAWSGMAMAHDMAAQLVR